MGHIAKKSVGNPLRGMKNAQSKQVYQQNNRRENIAEKLLHCNNLAKLWIFDEEIKMAAIQIDRKYSDYFTSVPMDSPLAIFMKLPSLFISNTIMGRLFSWQRVMAVMSITFNPLS